MFVCGNTSAFLGISFPLMLRGACDDLAKKSRELDAALSVVRWQRILLDKGAQSTSKKSFCDLL
ncbi:unnamed protein product, partial [Musa banksii]